MQFMDKVIDVVLQRQAQPIDKVVDVPEVLQTPVDIEASLSTTAAASNSNCFGVAAS